MTDEYNNKCLIQFTCASKYCKHYTPSDLNAEYKSTCADKNIYGDCLNDVARKESLDNIKKEVEK